jgi:ATP-dependent Clp protease ATP-binding subunit ClpB
LRSQESEGKKTGRTDVPLDPSKMGRESSELQANLRKRIVGQEEAIREIVSIYQMYLTGMNAPGRPIGNLLFLGPTGSGKTRIVEATAESLVNNTRAVIKIDCAEFQHSHEIAKLIGSPPGYLGHRETSPFLSQEVLNQYHTSTMRLSFVLFDEIEKASDALWNLLLGILDKGRLTLGDNRQVDFSDLVRMMLGANPRRVQSTKP